MTEPLIEKHAISTELYNVNREKHKLNFFPLTVYIIKKPCIFCIPRQKQLRDTSYVTRVACVAGGISCASAFVLVAKP